ncbi:MAG: DUF2157 domain-containing protein [Mycobacteriales bacterium]
MTEPLPQDSGVAAEPARRATAAQLDWLAGELPVWQAEGLVDPGQATALLHRYRATPRRGLAQLLLYLGAAFVGVGLIWLVAANLDQFTPIKRFVFVTVVWLAITVAAEWLSGRRAHAGGVASPVLGAARGLAALAFGAVIFQAAQSLQVPAYEPALLGWWALGALAYTYAVGGAAPLVVAISTGLAWFLWHVAERSGSALNLVLAVLLVGAAVTGIAALHERWGLRELAAPWREVGALLLLGGLFAAAVPAVDAGDFSLDPVSAVAGAAALLIALCAVVLGQHPGRLEPLVAVAVTVAGVLLIVWDPDYGSTSVGVVGWLHAGVSIVVYVGLATGIAVVGIRRSSGRLTYLALVSLVVFTTFQSFAVFAAIIEGAWLFLLLGLVFLGSGYGSDRARRQLEDALDRSAGTRP